MRGWFPAKWRREHSLPIITQSSCNLQIISYDINHAWRNRNTNGVTIPGQAAGFQVWGVAGAHPIIPNNNPARNYEGRVVVWYDWRGGIAWM